jgi:class 3 adenylate cyclase
MFRIGINLGDVVVEGEDLFGDGVNGVNVAARLEQLCGCKLGPVLFAGTDRLFERCSSAGYHFLGSNGCRHLANGYFADAA